MCVCACLLACYHALLACRATPLQNGYSPSELLICRMLRTTVPSTCSQQSPRIPGVVTLRAKDEHLKSRQKQSFDNHHGAREVPPLAPSDTVWVPDCEFEGSAGEEVVPHSYEVATADGTYNDTTEIGEISFMWVPLRETVESSKPLVKAGWPSQPQMETRGKHHGRFVNIQIYRQSTAWILCTCKSLLMMNVSRTFFLGLQCLAVCPHSLCCVQ